MCRRYPAETALSMGLMNAVVADDELEDEVTRWADELLRMSPRVIWKSPKSIPMYLVEPVSRIVPERPRDAGAGNRLEGHD